MTYDIVLEDTRTLYLFGENEHDYGGQKKQTTTQAVIRRCLNAHPVRTCYGPGLGEIPSHTGCAKVLDACRIRLSLFLFCE